MSFSVGQTIQGFKVLAVHDLAEFRASGYHLRHEATGLEVYHVANDDEENLFAFGFKTIPEDSSGVAHILEHTVLCGSERFPLKDPFVLLLKGSMNTFLNAFTFPDKTVYPASSTVAQDLFNIMEVYGDAVFFPQIKPEMFRQEGHRVEFDEAGKLVRKGVVYNEMKGNYSTHDSVASDWCYRSLWEGTAYEHDSGGDPAVIPSLTYEQFQAFHSRYYHPMNTLLFLYGNIPTEDYLAFVDQKFLVRFGGQAKPPVGPPPVLDLPAYLEPRRLRVTFPASSEDAAGESSSITVNWLLGSIHDPVNVLTWEIITELLIGTAASPLQRALVDSGLGDDLSAPSGLETELYRLALSVGLRGTVEGRETAIEDLITKCLSALVQGGFDPDLVEGTLRRFEFRAREIKGGPFGLRLMRRGLRGWLHGASPDLTLRFAPIMAEIRQRLVDNPRYFEFVIRDQLLTNTHRTTVTVVPDEGQNLREAEAEAAELAARQAALTEAERARIKADQVALETYQAKEDDPEALKRLPFLEAKDIPIQVRTIPHQLGDLKVGGTAIRVHRHDLYTNGITYIDLVLDVDHLQAEELVFLPFLLGTIPNLGLPGQGYEGVANRLGLISGGFAGYPESSATQDGSLKISAFFRFRSLSTNIAEAVQLCGRLILEADFSDQKRLADLFVENRNEFRSSLIPSGNGYAALRTERLLAPSEALEDLWRGITQMRLLEQLEADLGKDLVPALAEILPAVRRRLLSRRRVQVNIGAEGDQIEVAQKALVDWLGAFPEAEAPVPEVAAILGRHASPDKAKAWLETCRSSLRPSPEFSKASTGDEELCAEVLLLPSKVAFVAASMPGEAFGTKGYAAEGLIAHLLRTGQLWEKIRMKGGAYGASANNDGLAKIFTFSTYRDPNIVGSIKAFAEALDDIAHQGISNQDLVLAKIGQVAKEVRPMPPADQSLVAFRRFLYGTSDALRQANRDTLLGLQGKDLQQGAAALRDRLRKAYYAVIAGEEMVDKEERQHPTFKARRLDLSPS